MAGVESSAIDDELESYFTGFNDLLQQLESCADNLVTEYLERKLEDCVSILFGKRLKQQRLKQLLKRILSN